jgi:hypothetical protein
MFSAVYPVGGEELGFTMLRCRRKQDHFHDRKFQFQAPTSVAFSTAKTPSTNIQAPEKLQTSMSKMHRLFFLELGNWNFIGAWMLELGASFAVDTRKDRF